MSLADLKPYADLVSVIGAGIVFFSWIITNSFQQRYQGAKSSVETAQSENRLYSEIMETQQAIRGLAAQLINLSIELVRHDAAEANRGEDRLRREQFLLHVASKSVNASQIDFGTRFCANVTALARVLAHKSEAEKKLKDACAEIAALQAAKKDLFEKINALTHPSQPIDANTDEQYRRLERNYGEELLPRFGPALKAAAEASDTIYREVATRLAKLKRRALLMSRIAFVAYIFGTATVIFGRVLEKLVLVQPALAPELL